MALIEPRAQVLPDSQAQAPMISPDSQSPPAPAAPTAPGEGEGETPPQLPDNLIHIPAVQAIMAGSPPALSANIKQFSKNPAAELIAKNKDLLMQAGMGFYKSMSGDLGVIFNEFHIHPQDLQAADRAGKLTLLAPPFDSVNHAVSKSGLKNPVLRPLKVPTVPQPPSIKSPPQIAQTAPPPSPVMPQPAAPVRQATAALQKQILGARAKNAAVGSPTSGAAPGAGRLLNDILKPVV